MAWNADFGEIGMTSSAEWIKRASISWSSPATLTFNADIFAIKLELLAPSWCDNWILETHTAWLIRIESISGSWIIITAQTLSHIVITNAIGHDRHTSVGKYWGSGKTTYESINIWCYIIFYKYETSFAPLTSSRALAHRLTVEDSWSFQDASVVFHVVSLSTATYL